MPNGSDQKTAAQDEVPGWTIEYRRGNYSVRYWLWFIIATFGQTVPTPPRITYTLRNNSSGECRSVTLAGDHSPSDLVAATHSGSAPENG